MGFNHQLIFFSLFLSITWTNVTIFHGLLLFSLNIFDIFIDIIIYISGSAGNRVLHTPTAKISRGVTVQKSANHSPFLLFCFHTCSFHIYILSSGGFGNKERSKLVSHSYFSGCIFIKNCNSRCFFDDLGDDLSFMQPFLLRPSLVVLSLWF